MQSSLKVCKNSSFKICRGTFMCQHCPTFSLKSYKHTLQLFTALDTPIQKPLYLSAFSKIFNVKSLKEHLFLALSSYALTLLTVEKLYAIASHHHPLWVSFLQNCLSHLILNNLSNLPKTEFHFGFFSYSSLSYLLLQTWSIPSPLLCHPSL